MNTNDKLTPALQVGALIGQNFNLIKTIRQHKDQIAIALGEIFGLTESQCSTDVLCENIPRVASKWMRQRNLLDKGMTDLQTIGKKLGINGTPHEVMDRLSLFKFFYSQYKLICKLHASSCYLRALS